MASGTAGSDMSLGLTMLFGILAVVAAAGMLFLPLPAVAGGTKMTAGVQLSTAWAFAAAMVAAGLAVLAAQLYD